MIDEAEKSVWKCFCSFILTLQIGCAKFTEAYAHVHAKQGQSIQSPTPSSNCATYLCIFVGFSVHYDGTSVEWQYKQYLSIKPDKSSFPD